MERLHHQIAGVALVEIADVLDPPRHQGGRHEPGEIEHEDLFGRVPDAFGIVDHQRLALEPFEQIGGSDVGQVERRILAHQHHVDVPHQIDPPMLFQLEVATLHPLHRHRRGPGGQAPAGAEIGLVGQRLDVVVKHRVPALLRRLDQREARIPGDLDALQRVHLDSDA